MRENNQYNFDPRKKSQTNKIAKLIFLMHAVTHKDSTLKKVYVSLSITMSLPTVL